MSTSIKTYSELSSLSSFDDRFDYLYLGNGVGEDTFGSKRYLNQKFYTSSEWKDVRRFVALRDNGCDLGVVGYDIPTFGIVHHINPMVADDIINRESWILDPEYLVLTTHKTHNELHFGGRSTLIPVVLERKPNDTLLW